MNDQDVTVKLSLMQGILGYLGTRPYGEVFQIIQEQQALINELKARLDAANM